MMDTQTQAQIYLADQRGCSETDSFRSYHTFNFGPYVAQGREPFGALYLVDEDTLRAGASLTMQVEQPTQVVLLPVVGGLEYASGGETYFLEPGQAGTLSLAAGTTYSVANPYSAEFITCLQLWFTPAPPTSSPVVSQLSFDLATPNRLVPFFGNALDQTGAACSGFIGRFIGRGEGTYTVGPVAKGDTKRVFAFVLQGAFEIANRLLHGKDGLALAYEQDDVLEFEALSNDALLVMLTC